jgi:RsiW-degrading membrane proteinase PrsW (M82 family)
MPHLLCECGNLFEAPPGPATCPSCKQLHPLTAGKIKVTCPCGAELKAPARLAGKPAACPKCGEAVIVPSFLDDTTLEAAAIASTPAHETSASPPVTGARRWLPLLFTLTLVPLILSMFSPDGDMEERLKRTFTNNPDVAAKVEEFESADELLLAFPEHRIEGAYLPRDTWTHWIFAAVAAAGLWGAILVLYPLGNSTSAQLWKIGIFTGTLGILMLLAIQYIAEYTQGWTIIGRSILVIFFYILKFIGFSYRAATDPSNGFWLSMMGFTFGVGLCEELFKAVPLLWHYRRKATLNLRGAVAWGLASGIGFGISEGIHYSSEFYNGITTGGIYVVRFVSCVALHAAWTGATAILIYRRQEELRGVESWYEWFIPVLKILAVSMVLHGLYDTLLKRDMEAWAIITAVASFAWFYGYMRYTTKLDEGEAVPAPSPA